MVMIFLRWLVISLTVSRHTGLVYNNRILRLFWINKQLRRRAASFFSFSSHSFSAWISFSFSFCFSSSRASLSRASLLALYTFHLFTAPHSSHVITIWHSRVATKIERLIFLNPLTDQKSGGDLRLMRTVALIPGTNNVSHFLQIVRFTSGSLRNKIDNGERNVRAWRWEVSVQSQNKPSCNCSHCVDIKPR